VGCFYFFRSFFFKFIYLFKCQLLTSNLFKTSLSIFSFSFVFLCIIPISCLLLRGLQVNSFFSRCYRATPEFIISFFFKLNYFNFIVQHLIYLKFITFFYFISIKLFSLFFFNIFLQFYLSWFFFPINFDLCYFYFLSFFT